MNNSDTIIAVLDHPYVSLCIIFIVSFSITKLLLKTKALQFNKNRYLTIVVLTSYFFSSVITFAVVYYIGSLKYGVLKSINDLCDIGIVDKKMVDYSSINYFSILNLVISFLCLVRLILIVKKDYNKENILVVHNDVNIELKEPEKINQFDLSLREIEKKQSLLFKSEANGLLTPEEFVKKNKALSLEKIEVIKNKTIYELRHKAESNCEIKIKELAVLKAIVQLVRISVCGTEGRGFEPHWPHLIRKPLISGAFVILDNSLH